MKQFLLALALAMMIFPTVAFAQNSDRQITGRVTDDKGAALSGVTVQVKGTTLTTSTTADGNFSIGVPDTATTLVFSYVGMVTTEINVSGRTTVDVVQLTSSAQTL